MRDTQSSFTSSFPDGNYSSTSSFPDGNYNITIVAVDQFGNIGLSFVIFTVDATPPTVTINSPTAISYTTGNITVALSGDAEVYWYYIAGVDGSNQTWPNVVTRNLADGTYTLHGYGNDSAGNIAHVSVTFTIDTTSETSSTTETSFTTETTSETSSTTETTSETSSTTETTSETSSTTETTNDSSNDSLSSTSTSLTSLTSFPSGIFIVLGMFLYVFIRIKKDKNK